MIRCDNLLLLAGVLLLFNAAISAQQAIEPTDAKSANASVMAVMVATITPATDALWQADDPQSDEEWQRLVDAAKDTITAFESIRNGGTGPNDNTWALDRKWQRYTDQIVAAANDAIDAAGNRNYDALLEANDALYAPCEACHLDFHPGVDAED